MSIVRVRMLGECAISIGDREIRPDSPLLFAMTLYLTQAATRAVSKSTLLELLFRAHEQDKRASHSLRQLLYRLRGMGAPIVSQGERIQVRAHEIVSSVDAFALLTPSARAAVIASELVVLPSYEPRISPQFADWLEMLRSRSSTRIAHVLRNDFRSHVSACRWQSVVRTGRTLEALDASNEEVIWGTSEALAMLGRRDDAIDLLDSFLKDCEPSSVAALKRLRARVARSPLHVRTMESAFHGRSAILNALAQQWVAASSQEAQVAAIAGPAGIGKSRLLREFSSYVSLHGGQSLAYHCDPSDATRPHSLFRHLVPQLRTLRGSLGANPQLQPHLTRLTSPGSVPTSMEPASLEATRTDIQLAVIDLVEAVCAETTTLLVVDDAQFLDPASRAVLEALLHRNKRLALMLQCSYRDTMGDRLDFTRVRAKAYLLDPLSHEASMSVLRDLLPRHRDDEQFLEACTARAGGNPYYLHAIAHSASDADVSHLVPFDIRAFAAASYLGLDNQSRVLFESCLLLGRYATIKRVREVTAIDDASLVTALRTLEDQGLLIFADGDIRCAHAMLADATRAIIPGAVAAVLHERIAILLEREALAHNFPPPITATAAESWLNAGDVAAASRLLQLCAAQAASLGQPKLAASMLLAIPAAKLAAADRVPLLSAIAEYAEVSGSREIHCSSLRALYDARRALSHEGDALRELELRIIEADLERGERPSHLIAPLNAVLLDPSVPSEYRVRAGIQLLIAADMNLDTSLATSTRRVLAPVAHALAPDNPLRVRSDLIFETVFGDQHRACELASELLRSHPLPSLHRATVSARRNAALALSRIGRREQANAALLADYQFMAEHHVDSEAAFSAMLLVDHSLADGDVGLASRWLEKAAVLVKDEPGSTSLQASYLTGVASVALAEGRLEDAERAVLTAQELYPAVGLPRYEAIALALRMRVQLALQKERLTEDELLDLRRLFEVGGRLGAQDSVMETIWLCEHLLGRAETASAMLGEYLEVWRRELGPPEASLSSTTARDRSWQTYRARRSPSQIE